MAISAGIASVSIDGQIYNVAPTANAYHVEDLPSHADVDGKMERRLLYTMWSKGIKQRREDKSLDGAETHQFNRGTRKGEGFWWATRADSRSEDRLVCQDAVTTSSLSSTLPTGGFQGFQGTYKLVDKLNRPNSSATFCFEGHKIWGDGPSTDATPGSTWNVVADFLSGTGTSFTGGGTLSGTLNGTDVSSTFTSNAGDTTSQTNPNFYIKMDSEIMLVTARSGNNYTVLRGQGNSLTAIHTNGASFSVITPIVTDMVWFNGTLFIALCVPPATGTLTSYVMPLPYWTIFTKDSGYNNPTPTNGNGTNPTAAFFTLVRNQLWRSSGASVFSSTTASMNDATWSGASVIGAPDSFINGLDTFRDFLLVFKSDTVMSIDRGGSAYNLIPGIRHLGQNLRPLGQWRASYFFAADTGMIWEITGDRVNRVGFDITEPVPWGPSPVIRVPNPTTKGLALANSFIVGFSDHTVSTGPVSFYETGNLPATASGAYFLAWDGNAWHPVQFFANSIATGIGIAGTVQFPAVPRLVFGTLGTAANSGKISYVASSPLLDPVLKGTYDTSDQVVYLPGDNGVIEDQDKVLESVNIILDNSSSSKVSVAYAMDEDINTFNFTDMGRPQGDGTFFQQFTVNAPQPFYKKVFLRLTYSTLDSTKTPLIRSATVHYKQRQPQRRMFKIKLLADSRQIGQSGRADARSQIQILDNLNAARRKKQVTFQDIHKAQTYVYVDSVDEDLVLLRGAQLPSFTVNVILVEVAFVAQ